MRKYFALVLASMVCAGGLNTELYARSSNSGSSKQGVYYAKQKDKPAVKTTGKHANSKKSEKETYELAPARITNGSVTGFAYSLPERPDRGVNKDLLIAPASTMKVLTAVAALIQLGPNFQFKTELMADSNAFKNASKTGVLKSDLAIRFSGAPDLTSAKLMSLIKNGLAEKGIKKIEGNVYLDVSQSVGYDRGDGWPWDDLPLCFSAPASAATIDHNCVGTSIMLKKGEKRFEKPILRDYQPIRVVLDAPLLPPSEYKSDMCSLRVEPSVENVYTIVGCFSNSINAKKNYQLDFKFAVQNPNRWAEDIVSAMLNKLGITYKGTVKAVQRPVHLDVIDTIYSQSLKTLLDRTLKKSDNLYAEEIGKAAARSFYGHPVSIKQAAHGVVEILKKKAGINFKGSSIYDCSGLSSYNIISPQVVLDVLKYALSRDRELGMLALLPISTQSGTLRFRRSVVEYPLKNNVVAKTGTIRNVKNLAGYVKSNKGNFIPFVIYTNGLSPDKSEIVYMNKNKTMWPNFEFEKRVLRYLYEEKDPVIEKQ